MLRAGIAGGSGYGGLELIQLLSQHQEVQLSWLSSEKYVGEDPGEVFPHLRGLLDLSFSSVKDVESAALDILFLALPHGEAMKIVPRLADELTVIDLSGDFRLADADTFAEYYGFTHTSMKYQSQFVYGLPEINRTRLEGAKRIANPGCFATATILALYPLFREQLISGTVYVDSKTGSSGSGRTPSEKTHHPRRSQSLFPYKPYRHQHIPEMKQVLNGSGKGLIFQPHSTPLVRGIFASHYMQLNEEVDETTVKDVYSDYYGAEPFVRWVEGCPDVSSVQHSNLVDIGSAVHDGFLTVWSALDNLQKGAAGQAVQNMNITMGFEETTALCAPPSFP